MSILLKAVSALLTGGLSKFFETYRDVKFKQIEHDTALSQVERDIQLSRLNNEEQSLQHAKEIRLATKDFFEVRLAVGLIFLSTALHYTLITMDSIFLFNWNIAKLPPPFDEYEGVIVLSQFGYSAVRTSMNSLLFYKIRKGQ